MGHHESIPNKPLRIRRFGLIGKLAEFYPPYFWSQKKLWIKQSSIQILDLSRLTWILDHPVWCSSPPLLNYDSTPNVDYKMPEHSFRIYSSDLTFPITVLHRPVVVPGQVNPLLNEHQQNYEWIVLDGIHRLLKARLQNELKIKASVITDTDLEECFPTEEDFSSGFLNPYKSLVE